MDLRGQVKRKPILEFRLMTAVAAKAGEEDRRKDFGLGH